MNEEKELPTLLHLNDDCLYNIFNKLSIKEHLQLANTCERFRFIITHMIWRTQFQEMNTDDAVTRDLNDEQYLDLFYHIVEHIEKFTIPERYRQCCLVRPEAAFFLSSHFPRLTHFECHDLSLHDGLLRLIVEICPKLQMLKITSPYITGAHIINMRNLRELYLRGHHLRSERLSDIIEHLNLTHLGAESLGLTIPFNEFGFSKLRYLKLYENQIAARVALKCSYLRNLECLTVTHIKGGWLSVPIWEDLLKNLGASIVTLKMYNIDRAMHFLLDFDANTSKLTILEKICVLPYMSYDDQFCFGYDSSNLTDAGYNSIYDFLNNYSRLPALREFTLFLTKDSSESFSFLNFISESKYLQRLHLVCHKGFVCDNFHCRIPWLDIIEVLRKQKERSTLCLNIVHVCMTDLIFEKHIFIIKRKVLEDMRYVNQSLLKITFDMPPMKITPTSDTRIEINFNKESIIL